MIMRFPAIICFLLLCLANSTHARVIYVNNTMGDDRYRGESPDLNSTGDGPCRTIRRALQLAHNGDFINIAKTGKVYREEITLQGERNSGNKKNAFTILGNGATLEGTAPVAIMQWKHYRANTFFFKAPTSGFQQLFYKNLPLERREIQSKHSLPNLKPLQWCMKNGNIYFCTEPAKAPSQYRLRVAKHRVGITLYKVTNVKITGLTIQGYQLDGVNAHDGVYQCQIDQVISRGNGRSGFSIGGSSQVTLQKCLAGSNGTAQLRTEGWSTVKLEQSELSGDFAPSISQEKGKRFQNQKIFINGVLAN